MPDCLRAIEDPRHQGRILAGRALAVPGLPDPHPVSVYLPPGYDRDRQRRYPIAVLLDGQNLFGDHGSFAGGWHLHRLLDWRTCAGEGVPIVVAVHTGLSRQIALSPWPAEPGEPALGWRMAEWLAGPLLNLAQSEFRVRRGPEHAMIGGASLGGLLSLYTFFRHGDAFGRALAMSPNLGVRDGRHGPAFGFAAAAPFPPGGRLYLDAGGLECPCGHVLRHAADFVGVLAAKGLVAGRDYLFRPDPDGAHDEAAWRRRLPGAIHFLLE